MSTNYSPSVRQNNLQIYHDFGNPKSYPGEPTTNIVNNPLDLRESAGWDHNGTQVRDAIDPYGGNNAWHLRDNDGSNFTVVERFMSVPDDSTTYTASALIKKDDVTDRFPAIGLDLQGGSTQLVNRVNINTATGATGISGGASNVIDSGSLDLGDWWKLYITVANNSTGNTSIQMLMNPSRGTSLTNSSVSATGNAVFYGPQIEANDHPTVFVNGSRSATNNSLDLTANNHHGDYQNSPVHDIEGGYLTFTDRGDSTSDHFTLGTIDAFTNLDPTTPFTLIAWVNPSKLNERMWAFGQRRSTYVVLGMADTNVIRFRGDDAVVSGGTTLQTDTWYQIAGVNYSATDARVFINGQQDGTGNLDDASTGTPDFSAGNWFIGTEERFYESWDGKIAMIMGYDAALTAAEIEENFEAHRGRFGI